MNLKSFTQYLIENNERLLKVLAIDTVTELVGLEKEKASCKM